MQANLKRSLSLPLVTFYGIGTILGAGIYVLVGKVAGFAGMFTPFAFMMALLLAGFSAFSYAELSARFPKSAGEAVYVHEGLGWRKLSIIVGVSITFAGIISVATLLHGFVGYLQVYLGLPDALVIITLGLSIGLIVAWGITESVMIATLMTLVEMAGLILIIWVARDSFGQLPAQLPEMVPPLEWAAWGGIMMGGFIAFYAFLGFEDIVNVAEEVRDPSRTLPRAIILALIIITLFYLLVSVVAVLTMSTTRLAETDAPLALIYTHTTGNSPVIITLISLIAVLNGALVQVIKASRVLYGMSRQGWLPPRLGRLNPRTHTPLVATAIVTGLVLLFALWLPLLSLAKLTSFITLMVFALMNFSLVLIKIRTSQPEDIFIIPMWVPVIGLLLSSTVLIYQSALVLMG
jgi:amino acid transporter